MKHIMDQVGERQPPGLSPSLVGIVIGTCTAIPMYLWQSNVQIAISSFLIAGYTAMLWTHSHNAAILRGALHAELMTLPVNTRTRRTLRMLGSPAFWWTVLFGGGVVCGSVWFAGMTEPITVAGVAAAWCLIACCLRFGLTLVQPRTSCRRCGYDLSVQIAFPCANGKIVCPECGAAWSGRQLGRTQTATTAIDWRQRAA